MTKRYIDLTMMLEEGMQTFPAHYHCFVEITQLGRHGIEDRETRRIVLSTHVGTHIDAPRHFIKDGGTVENIPLDAINGAARLLDFSHLPAKAEVSRDMLVKAAGSGSVERLIIRFDGDKRLGTMAYYEDQPYLSEDACTWLVENGCRLIGMDVAQPDNPLNGRTSDNDSPNHKILLGAKVVILEYMVNLAALPEEFDIVVAPLKIKEGDGAPARVFAVVDA